MSYQTIGQCLLVNVEIHVVVILPAGFMETDLGCQTEQEAAART